MRDKILWTMNGMFNYDFTEQEVTWINRVIDYRKMLAQSEEVFRVRDYSTGIMPEVFATQPGMDRSKHQYVKLSWLNSTASAGTQLCLFLYRLVRMVNPKRALELGACIGMGTIHIAMALEQKDSAGLVTVEGDVTLSERTIQHLKHFGLDGNVMVETALFDDWLDKEKPVDKYNFVYLDGDHGNEATLRYWEKLKPICAPGCILMFDDINWTGMREAWKEIITDKAIAWHIGDETRHRFGILQLKG